MGIRNPLRTVENAERIKLLRAEGLTWDQVAEAVGMPAPTVKRWSSQGLPCDARVSSAPFHSQLQSLWLKSSQCNAGQFDRKAAAKTGRSVEECRATRLALGLTRNNQNPGTDELAMRREEARKANDRFVAHWVSICAAKGLKEYPLPYQVAA